MQDSAKKISYKDEIRPLFRQKDINSMKRRFDLSKYEDVYANADKIYDRLKKGDMPCDGAWLPDDVALFEKWIADGKMP
jgi:hypothetical protein